MRVEIRTLTDEHDCETCGSSWAEGYHVEIDGVEFNDYTPTASCFGNIEYRIEDVMKDILTHLGVELHID